MNPLEDSVWHMTPVVFYPERDGPAAPPTVISFAQTTAPAIPGL